MEVMKQADSIHIFSLKSPHMRTFHLTWFAFFICFLAWFGVAPLMIIVREEFALSKEQIGNIMIASVFFTIFARIVVGFLCDRFGPRLTYTGLLAIGSLPVFGSAFSKSYESLLIMRFLVGGIGAAFVITQYHTTVMFSPKVVGTANATTAGWGNLGGGVSQILMPLIFSFFIYLGFSESLSWRLGLGILGFIMLLYSFVYFKFTKDLPYGNFKDQKIGHWDQSRIQTQKAWRPLRNVMKDQRVWVLFLVYGACFGIELTINNMAAIYFHDKFNLSLTQAGLIAGLFGIMNLFARTLGGWFGDQASSKYGIQGRVHLLGIVLFLEGLALCLFSRMDDLLLAIVLLVGFSLFVQMAEGATFSVVPFVNQRALGTVSGIVGAGGNVGAVAAGYLFRLEEFAWSNALFLCGIIVTLVSFSTAFIRLQTFDEIETVEELAHKASEKIVFS